MLGDSLQNHNTPIQEGGSARVTGHDSKSSCMTVVSAEILSERKRGNAAKTDTMIMEQDEGR